jgi:hypothetical protein
VSEGARAEQVADTLGPVLAELGLWVILPDDPARERFREMLFVGHGVSLRTGSTIFYTDNGEPIELPDSEAFAKIAQIREGDGGEITTTIDTNNGVPLTVFTAYVGVDLSTCGPVPLVWETQVFVGEPFAYILGPWRYATRAAAHDGHSRVVYVVRQAVDTP